MKNNMINKLSLKSIRAAVAVFVFISLCFCLNAADDEILLPDISTTIIKPGNGIPVESDAVPDFRLLLPETGIVLPDIADTGLSPDTFIPPKTDYTAEITDGSESEVSNVFIEGAVGAGFPGLFSGDFSVYRNEGTEPFSLNFSHLTENGYGLHSASSGYSTSKTMLSGQKTFTFTDALCLELEGVYSTKADGLQGKSPLFYMLSKQDISGNADFLWTIGENMNLSSNVGVMFNNQFAGYNSPLPSGVAGSAFCFLIDPRVVFTYTMPVMDGTELSLQAKAGYDGGTKQNRFEGGAAAELVIGDYGTASTSVDVVWTKNMAASVVVPLQFGFKTGQFFPFTGAVSGGLKSSPANFAELQNAIPYMFTNVPPYEESLWFVAADCSVPYEFSSEDGKESAFSIKKIEPSLKIDFAKTAFGNESLKSFTKDSVTGLMIPQLADRLVFNTALSTSVFFLAGGVCDVDFALGWKGCWFDKDVLEESQSLSVKVGASHVNGLWGTELELLISFMGEVPNLKISGFYKLSNSMRLELELADFIKLVTGKDRLHCGEYIQKGGSAAVYVKVLF